MTVKEFLEHCKDVRFEAKSAFNDKLLFKTAKGKNYERWQDSEVMAVWSEIRILDSDGYENLAIPTVCFSVDTGVLRTKGFNKEPVKLPVDKSASERGKIASIENSTDSNCNATYERDKFILELNGEKISWIYYNPDADSGGQFVINSVYKRDIPGVVEYLRNNPAELCIGELVAFFDRLGRITKQELVDIDSSDFEGTKEYYSSSEAFAFDCSEETKTLLINWAKS